ncbi:MULTISPECIES: hypothetical protein [Bacillus cereus group]|uniref:hypothetical protein n=1 Tax=Bacillus cereus group TaxID=86661 RepID=UPI00111CEEA9|nr:MULTISPECIES: hypothetical protein [Bacillus cereus group]
MISVISVQQLRGVSVVAWGAVFFEAWRLGILLHCTCLRKILVTDFAAPHFNDKFRLNYFSMRFFLRFNFDAKTKDFP